MTVTPIASAIAAPSDADGSPVSDDQLESGEFVVAAQVGGEDWWVVLDMDHADIVLNEQETA